MIDFDCKYVFGVPAYMMEACWTGYLLDLFNMPNGGYARLIFVYPDTGVVDVSLSLHIGLDHLIKVSLINLDCSFCIRDIRNTKANARIIYDAGISIDTASGIAIAINVILELLAVTPQYERLSNIADFHGMSITAEDAISMFGQCSNNSEVPF